jgi:hypothetical protein
VRTDWQVLAFGPYPRKHFLSCTALHEMDLSCFMYLGAYIVSREAARNSLD